VQTPDGPSSLVTYTNASKFGAWGLELESRYASNGYSLFFNSDVILGNKGDIITDKNGPSYNFKFVPTFTIATGASAQWGRWGSSVVLRGIPSTGSTADNRVHGAILGDLNFTYGHDSICDPFNSSFVQSRPARSNLIRHLLLTYL
jgi:hypothetical protein